MRKFLSTKYMLHSSNFLYCSQRNNYQIVLNLAHDKKLKSKDRNENWVGLLLVQLIAKTNSFFSFFFFFFFWRKNISSLVEILSLAYYLVWSMVNAYIPYRSIRRGDCSLICIKLGSITPCSFRISLLIWHTLCVGCACTIVQPIKNKSRSDEDSYIKLK